MLYHYSWAAIEMHEEKAVGTHHVTMDDPLRVAEVECLEELVQVVANVVVGELGVEQPGLEVVDVLGDDRRRFALCVGRTGTSVSILFSTGIQLDGIPTPRGNG